MLAMMRQSAGQAAQGVRMLFAGGNAGTLKLLALVLVAIRQLGTARDEVLCAGGERGVRGEVQTQATRLLDLAKVRLWVSTLVGGRRTVPMRPSSCALAPFS